MEKTCSVNTTASHQPGSGSHSKLWWSYYLTGSRGAGPQDYSMFTASSSTHSLLLASPVKDSYCPPPAIVLGLITVPGLNSEPKKGSALTQTLPPQFPAPTLATLPHGLSPHPSNVSSWLTWEPFSLKFWGSLAPSPLPLEF